MAAFNDGRVMPPGYEPFQYLDVCGNLLENVKVIFEIANVVPLLVGRGEQFPKIWLALPWPRRGVIQADQEWILAVDGDQMPERLIEPLRSTLRLENASLRCQRSRFGSAKPPCCEFDRRTN